MGREYINRLDIHIEKNKGFKIGTNLGKPERFALTILIGCVEMGWLRTSSERPMSDFYEKTNTPGVYKGIVTKKYWIKFDYQDFTG